MSSRTFSFTLLLLMLAAFQVCAGPNASDVLNPAALRNRILARMTDRTQFLATSKKQAMAKVAKKSGGTGSISGTVYQSDGTTPASSISLECFDSYGYPVENISYNPAGASNGLYLIDKLYPGTYLVRANRTFYGNTKDIAAAQWITVGTAAVTGKNIIAQTSSADSIKISGICYLGAGTATPFARGTIEFEIVDTNSRLFSSNVHDWDYESIQSDGSYAVALDAPAGMYYVMVSARTGYSQGYRECIPQWYNGTEILSFRHWRKNQRYNNS